MSCPLCEEEIEAEGAEYCPSHTRAFTSLRNAFRAWTTAYGNISVTDFLDRLVKLPGTGQKSREIAQFLREDPSRWK